MSEASYRDAVQRLRDALDGIWPYRGVCGFCGHPDARHRVADAVTERLLAGEDARSVADDYGLGDVDVLDVAVWVLAADIRRHNLTRGRAAGVDREVWADVPR